MEGKGIWPLLQDRFGPPTGALLQNLLDISVLFSYIYPWVALAFRLGLGENMEKLFWLFFLVFVGLCILFPGEMHQVFQEIPGNNFGTFHGEFPTAPLEFEPGFSEDP